MVQGNSKNSNIDYSGTSTILAAKYGNEAMKLIGMIGRNLSIVILLVAIITVISLTNAVGFHYIFGYEESVDFIIDISLSVVLVLILIPLVFLFMRSKKVLDNWTYMFERSTLTASFTLALTGSDKKSAIRAVAQTVKPIGELLQEYIETNDSSLDEFLDVSFGNKNIFDVLIDSEYVSNFSNGRNNKVAASLRDVLEEYGAISIEILENIIDVKSIEHYIEKIDSFTSSSNRKISIGIIIGESISLEAKTFVENYLKNKRKSVHLIVLIERPHASQLV